MGNTTYVSVRDLSLVEDAKFGEWDRSLHRLLVPLLFRIDSDRPFNCQPEHMYWFSAGVAVHPDGSGEYGGYSRLWLHGPCDTEV